MIRPVVSAEPLTGTEDEHVTPGEEENFSVYPVPADKYLYLDTFNAEQGTYRLFILDITGRRIGEYDPAKNKTIFTGDLKPGVYIAILLETRSGRQFTKKLIINH